MLHFNVIYLNRETLKNSVVLKMPVVTSGFN